MLKVNKKGKNFIPLDPSLQGLKFPPPNQPTKAQDAFITFLSKYLNIYLQKEELEKVKYASTDILTDGTKTIIAEFLHLQTRNKILKIGKKKLKKSKFIIFEDVFKFGEEDEESFLFDKSKYRQLKYRYGHKPEIYSSSSNLDPKNLIRKCNPNKLIFQIEDPIVVKTSGMPYGAWMRDTFISDSSLKNDFVKVNGIFDLEIETDNKTTLYQSTLGDPKIYLMDHFYQSKKIQEFSNLQNFIENNLNDEYTIPNIWAGTGHIVYNRHVFYSKYNSSKIIKYSLDKRKIQGNFDLEGAVFGNEAPYQWRGSTDIDLATDENGLWAIYATKGGLEIVIKKCIQPEKYM